MRTTLYDRLDEYVLPAIQAGRCFAQAWENCCDQTPGLRYNGFAPTIARLLECEILTAKDRDIIQEMGGYIRAELNAMVQGYGDVALSQSTHDHEVVDPLQEALRQLAEEWKSLTALHQNIHDVKAAIHFHNWVLKELP
ncbi:hypothetical protein GCM10008927_25200 [Amylibacter ulvae]|uniref:Uncharacterized protein n=1 Tax=Paramylibacter ulvae TaxID=1651968 RepID=A0ABQ3D9Z8_9RHOB|nr:hypothetical protein [Amylibacter ulvae]GHA58519.1 hypothetical protein GCM10008927_25200 [Amylibacter ulvae]